MDDDSRGPAISGKKRRDIRQNAGERQTPANGANGVRDVEVMRIRLLGGADPLVRGRPPGRPLLFW